MDAKREYEKICSLMDDRGFLPPHNCKICGEPLDTSGDRPAELYLGTYTGLCNKCTMSGPFVVKEYRDGARQISYAPHCPSHRRDREKYISYADCEVCKGTGRLYVSRGFASGGSYYRYCKECLDRYCNDPLRIWADRRRKLINLAAQAVWEKVLRKNRLLGKAKRGEIKQERVQALAAPVQKRKEQALEQLGKLVMIFKVYD